MPAPTSDPTWSRLVRFIPSPTIDDPVPGPTLGEPVDVAIDVGLAYHEGVMIEVWLLYGDPQRPWTAGRRTGEKRVVAHLLCPVSNEICGTIRATGLSYKDHAAELNMPLPAVPSVFFKPSTSLANPSETIHIPLEAQNEEMDYEVELAIVLSRTCKDVSENEALSYVLGWTCANDLTARKVQATSSQWGYSKGFDKFLPLGPVLVSPRALPDPHIVALQTYLNGQLMQDGSAKKMIFPLSKVISYLSQGTTLPAGTVIITGTPPGIGDGRTPKVWLKHNDEVRCWISHGIGTLINRIEYQ
ncbi:putative mitochondrion protein [Naematelia encephala]|uniref:Putative mitochondrion protein n=1 Tax=Naematelia encephala TaxID=71784 RepID=A0A1Y2AU36_9TREE|nr:putative mitochondrion protein [Naematelia encephala]